MPTLFSTSRTVNLPSLKLQEIARAGSKLNPYTPKPKAKHTPVIVDLPYGATSEYTACRHCGARFTQRDGTRRFRALAKHYANECKG